MANVDRGVCHIQLEQYDEALADADRAIELAPWLPEGYLVRADVLTARSELDAALADCATAVKVTPEDMKRVLAVSLKCRGSIEFALGRWADAVRDLQFVDGSPDVVNTDRALLLYFASERMGFDGREELMRHPTSSRPGWGKYVEGVIGGWMSENDTAKAIDGPDDRCMVDFYFGEWHLQRKELDAARQRLAAVTGCHRDSLATVIGAAELARLADSDAGRDR